MTWQAVSTSNAPSAIGPYSQAIVANGFVFCSGYENVDDFAAINAVYGRHMPDPPPARSAPGNVRLPRNLLISIEAIAVLPTG